MVRTFKVLSLLLSYPTEEIQSAAPSFRAILEDEGIVPDGARTRLNQLVDQIATGDLYDLQERYVLLFDRTRSLSLHLFEHVHGESRDRGSAMLDLKGVYESHGLDLAANELPDYLPLFVEFLSLLDIDEARGMLAQPLHIIVALKERLQKRDSIYSIVFRCLERIANAAPAVDDLDEIRSQPDDDPDDFDALDKSWEDQPVLFGPGGGPDQSCGTAGPASRPASRARPGATTLINRLSPDTP